MTLTCTECMSVRNMFYKFRVTPRLIAQKCVMWHCITETHFWLKKCVIWHLVMRMHLLSGAFTCYVCFRQFHLIP